MYGKVHLCTGTEALYRPIEGVEVQLYYFLIMALEGGEETASRVVRFYPGKDPVPIVREAGWTPGQV